jgi:hypothetical protein
MSDSSHCRFCGQAIVFRMMQGRCVPMHPEGGCPGHSCSREDDEKKADCLYATTCPKDGCGQPVYFLRHNGGCTWLDNIPYPWPKHGCFLDQSDPIPESWQQFTTGPGKGIVVRIYSYSLHKHSVTLMPVDKKLRKWFKDLGTFNTIFEQGVQIESIDCQLALVTAEHLESGSVEFRATTLKGHRMLLIPRRS